MAVTSSTGLWASVGATPAGRDRHLRRTKPICPVRGTHISRAVGKNRHYAVEGIVPRRFLRTDGLSGVGAPLIRTIFEELAANAESQTAAVIEARPGASPDRRASSVLAAVKCRARLLVTA